MKVNEKTLIKKNIKHYLHLAQAGHFPLFFEQWIKEDLKLNKPVSYSTANENVHNTFKMIVHHNTDDKKKIALSSLEQKERQVFLNSFIKLVEHNALKGLKTLH